MTRPEPTPTLGLFRLLCVLAALVTVGAGVIHLLTVADHREHPLIAAFFVVTALAQLGWAVAVTLWPSKFLLLAGIAGNLAVVATWALTRTTGLPFVTGAEEPEAVGFRDAIATLFETLATGAAGLALTLPAAVAATVLPAGRRAVAVAAAAVLLLTTPAALAGHAHDDSHGGDVHAAKHADGGDTQGAHGHDAGSHDAGGHDAKHKHGAGDSHDQHSSNGHGDQHLASGHHGDGHPAGGHQHSGGGHGTHPGHGGGQGGGHGGGHDHGTPQPESFPQPKMWGTKTTMRIGPFYLPAAEQGGDAHFNRFGLVPQKPCQDCFITGIVPRLVYADGSNADVDTGPMLHHIVITDTGRQDPTCERWNGSGLAGHRIFASGNERTRFAMPRGFGYRATSSPWAYIAEIMNHSASSKTVYVEADVYHVPTSTKGMKPVTPVWLDVANCRDSEFTAPPGRSTKTWSWKSTLTGRVIGAGGHVHAGGVGIVLRNASTGKRMCTSEAAYGRGAFEGEVTQMSTCIWDRIGTVREGQSLAIDTIYHTPKAAEGVMGILMLVVYETDNLSGGSSPPAWMTRNPDTRPPQSGGHGH